MVWSQLKVKLDNLQKDGWEWSMGYSHGYSGIAQLLDPLLILPHSGIIRQGRHVISEWGNSPEDALTKVLSRHEKSTFDPDPL